MASMALSSLFPRFVQPRLAEALEDARVVYVTGPRQAGKTTIARQVAAALEAEYQTLDDRTVREFALAEPEEFLERDGLLVVDEVQRGGDDLLLALKARVDRDPTPGQYLLTGSTRFLTVPTMSESLAGRVELVDLWPLAQSEIERKHGGLVDGLFGSTRSVRSASLPPVSRAEVFERVCRGGFPEPVGRSSRSRGRWFDAYARTLTGRDVGELANIQRVQDLPALVRLLAARTATAINLSSLAADAGIPRTTLAGYMPLLEDVFLMFRLPAWSRNLTSKGVKQPKLHFTDTGLAAHLVGTSPSALARPQAPMAGALLESFVASELARLCTWSNVEPKMHHFRDRAGSEVDLILEARDGRIVAVEVKAGRSVGRGDTKALAAMRDRLGDEFVNGVVLGCFERAQPLGDRLTALPLSALWA